MSIDYLEKSVDCILLEIAFTGISYGINDHSARIIQLLKERNKDADYPIIAEVMLLLNRKQFSDAHELIVKTLENESIKETDMLKVFRCLVLKVMGNDVKFTNEINKLLSSDIKDPKALIFVRELAQS